jgi:catechol 2,3-dioxygenase-like lactoylglutathione lyase family enzyme
MTTADSSPGEGLALTTILVVSDVTRSRDWYVDVLGASLYREYGGTSAVLTYAGAWLLLVTGGEPTADKPTVTFAAPSEPDLVSHAFTIRVPDCQAAYEALRARGATFLTPPYDWGRETRCFFRDPDGHLFEISQAG